MDFYVQIYHNYDKLLEVGGSAMKTIRPISDLRNNFAEISKLVHEQKTPVFLTKNGYGDMVVMSMEAFENFHFESEVYEKLKEAELQASQTDKRYSSKEVLSQLKKEIQSA